MGIIGWRTKPREVHFHFVMIRPQIDDLSREFSAIVGKQSPRRSAQIHQPVQYPVPHLRPSVAPQLRSQGTFASRHLSQSTSLSLTRKITEHIQSRGSTLRLIARVDSVIYDVRPSCADAAASPVGKDLLRPSSPYTR